jgi:hypothetical protein
MVAFVRCAADFSCVKLGLATPIGEVMTRPTSNDQARENEQAVPLDVERQQQASDHTNIQPGSAPASNEHGGRRLGETGGGKAGEENLG